MNFRARLGKYFETLFSNSKAYGDIVPNINLDLSKKQRKVLIIYIDYKTACIQISNFYDVNDSGTLHTNRLELFQIIKAFIELDCCIDVCSHDDCNAKKYVAENNYDIVFGIGGGVLRWACNNINAYKILYMTENPYDISYMRENERILYFQARHNKKWRLERTGKFYREKDEELADMIITLGEIEPYKNKQIGVSRLYPSGLYNHSFSFCSDNKDRRSFLVFGTDGFIHKGNDLLVDIFKKHPEWTLYMCGSNVTANIRKIMGYNIEGTNIVDCGYINVNGDRYLELVNKCVFVLQPSCSEASSTGVLTCMRHGMVPIVMHGNGFDKLDEYCYFFESYFLDDIEKTINEKTALPYNILAEKSKSIYTYANNAFTIESFGKNIFDILSRHLL